MSFELGLFVPDRENKFLFLKKKKKKIIIIINTNNQANTNHPIPAAAYKFILYNTYILHNNHIIIMTISIIRKIKTKIRGFK
jgi:hypothetical protein